MLVPRRIGLVALLFPLALGRAAVAAEADRSISDSAGAPGADQVSGSGTNATGVGGAASDASTSDARKLAVDPAEMKDFKATAERFLSRANELWSDAVRFVDLREQEERIQLQKSYDKLLQGLENDDDTLRVTAIRHFDAFLAKYPTSPQAAHVMFRLAELYYEKAEEEWQAADEQYRRLTENLSDEQLADVPEEPKKDYSRSIELYQRIIDEFPSYEYIDGAYYMLGYCYSQLTAQQYDEDKGVEEFQKLVDKYPNSEFAAAAHLRIGEYYFDYNKLDQAIPHYQAVMDLDGPNGNLYDKALYKLAWSYYKKSDYDKALVLLTELLDWSEKVYRPKTGKDSAMAPEAIQYTAISFSDVADQTGQSPIEVAQAFYKRVGERDFEHDVYKHLAEVLTQQARYRQAIAAYEYLQERWPDDPENPTYEWKVGTLYMSLPEGPEPDKAQQAIALLTQRYNDNTDWWRANRDNPDALDTARSYIERSLAAVATQYHETALKTGKAADFLKAADLYKQYLTKFPFADDYYEIEWYRADTLLKGGDLDAAEHEYEQLIKADDRVYRDGALWQLMQVRRQKVINVFGRFDTVPANAAIERQIDLPSGKKRPVYVLDDIHKKFIEICDRLVDADFTPDVKELKARLAATKDPKVNETLEQQLKILEAYAKTLDENRVALAYLPGQILYYYGHYDEARPRLKRVIKQWPQHDEASYSAGLIIDSYSNEEDLENVRKYAADYKSRQPPLGSVSAAPEGGLTSAAKKWGTIEEQATFKLAMRLVESGRREEAAKAFLDFIKQYPKSQYVKDALYNAAHNYEIGGEIDKANELFERYVNTYPDDKRSRPLLFRIANNYAAALELDKAVQYFEQLYNQTRGKGIAYADAPAALYNAAFLRIGMGDHAGAARDFERYAVDNPEQADAEQAFFQAGAEWEQVGSREAIDFYRRYLARYQDTNPDHVMEAEYRIAKLTEKEGVSSRAVDRAWDDIIKAYDRLSERGEIGAAGRHYAALAELRKLQADFEAFSEITYPKNQNKLATLLTKTKKQQGADLVNRCLDMIQKYRDFDGSSGALYIAGMTYLTYADMLFNAPPPPGFDEEEIMFYQEALDKIRIPTEDEGRKRLELSLKKARDEGRWNEWLTQTLDELSKRYPSDYPKVKQEFQAEADTSIVPMAGPLSAPAASLEGQRGDKASTSPGDDEAAPAAGSPTSTPTGGSER